MKKAVLFLSAFILTLSVFAQEKTVTDVIKFNETVYDFGKIKQGVPVYHDFMFTNISANPIVIESAVPSCGCTTPVKPEGAVPKGKENKIIAGFNAANPGPFNKSITVKVAGIDVPVQLIIKGEVMVTETPDKPKS
jgi:hypothetical protein